MMWVQTSRGRQRHFRGGALLVLVLLLAGCASTGMNLAQELAWDRWKKCDHFPYLMQLKEIRQDGQVWVLYDAGANIWEWKECMRKAAEEQAARRAAVVPPPAATVTAPLPQIAKEQPPVVSGPPLAPIWKVGDEWAYRWESPQGKGTYVWSVDRVEIWDGAEHYVIKSGTRELWYRTSDFASRLEKVSGDIVIRYTPFGLFFPWPLTPGKSWELRYTEDKPVERQTNEIVRTCQAESEETVTVAAGTFRTLKVVCRNQRTGSPAFELWVSPDVKQSVRVREYLSYGVRERELIAFKLK